MTKIIKGQRYTNGTITIKVVKVSGNNVTILRDGMVSHMAAEYFETNFKAI